VILITFFIYSRAGREIYKKHKQLRDFSMSTTQNESDPLPALEDLFSSTKTTEVYVTTEVLDKASGAINLGPLETPRRHSSVSGPGPKPPKAAYSVTISSNRHHEPQGGDIEGHPIQPNLTIDSQATTAAGSSTAGAPRAAAATTTTTTTTTTNKLRHRAAYEANSATWSYTKCSLLFFTAMLVTWIPSSANRVFSLAHGGEASLTLEYMSAFVLPLQGFWNAIIYIVTSWHACKMLWDDMCAWWPRCCGGRGGGGRRANLGSSAGRRRGRRGDMEVGSGMPTPGDLVPGMGHLRRHYYPHRSAFQMMGSGRNGSKASDSKTYETESMTELAGSRPGSSAGPATPAEVADRLHHHDHHHHNGKEVERL
jgi:hypothetical protein